jgi:excisionase family DNA binding protein
MEVTSKSQAAEVLFELLLNEIRTAVQSEIGALREDIKCLGGGRRPAIVTTAKRFYSVKEAAAALNVSEVTVRRLIARGLLRPSRALRHLRIPKEQIEEFIRFTV